MVAEALPGDTVLMHMHWNGFNPDAITRMKVGIEARGLELCRIDGPGSARGAFTC